MKKKRLTKVFFVNIFTHAHPIIFTRQIFKDVVYIYYIFVMSDKKDREHKVVDFLNLIKLKKQNIRILQCLIFSKHTKKAQY